MAKDIWSHSHEWDLGYAKGHKDGYEQGKADAEREFQNSEYWNDYLAKILTDERANTVKEFAYLYREFLLSSNEITCSKTDIECDGMCIDCFEKWLKEQ